MQKIKTLSKCWITKYILLDILAGSIAVLFNSSFVFWLIKIYSDTTHYNI